jgi:glycosyltransferase involved in cell wall biosynthesis
MKLAIVTPTYQRKDGKTPTYLNRAIDSLKKQTYKNFKFFLIGDKYEDDEEFNRFSESLTGIEHYLENLPIAKERDKYSIGDRKLWVSGGVNAYNHGLQKALDDGLDWICHLDHDDYWSENHLSEIVNIINTVSNVALVYTCAQYLKNQYIPGVKLDDKYEERCPEPVNVAHSSVCINHKLLPLRYRDVFEETGEVLEADIDMWRRISKAIKSSEYKSILVRKKTCYHTEEGVSK